MDFLWVLSLLACFGSALGCGLPAIDPVITGYPSKIVNGEEAVPHSWPWQASLQTDEGFHYCGASLVNESWLVTAAHCRVSNSTVVVLGEHDRFNSSEDVQTMKIEKVFVHPSYGDSFLNNDIQLIKLASPAKLSSHVSPVCVAEAGDREPDGLLCVTSGWGMTSNWTAAHRLQQVALPLISSERCKEIYLSIFVDFVTEQMICAGASGVSTCFGDSGGPLVCQREDSAWTLVGVTSWGKGCDVDWPAAFARITALRSWMNEIIAAN